MATGRLVAVALLGLGLAAVCLVLASVPNSPGLAVVGAACIALVLAAREGWFWRGEGRQAAVMVLVLLLVVGAGAVAEIAFG